MRVDDEKRRKRLERRIRCGEEAETNGIKMRSGEKMGRVMRKKRKVRGVVDEGVKCRGDSEFE